MWIVGASETKAQDGTEKGHREESAGSVSDDVRLAIQPEVYGPPTSGLGTAHGEGPRDDGKETDQASKRRD